MTRQQEFTAAVEKVTRDSLKASSREPQMLHADMCWDYSNCGLSIDWSRHKIAAGLEKQFISNLGMVTCKKVEAIYLLTIGDKTECGCFIVGKYKNYWLKRNDGL